MQIHEYNPLGRSLTGADAFVVDTGTVTAKVLFSNLKAAIDGRILTGASAAAVSVPAGSYTDRTYTFSTAFSAAPTVLVQLQGSGDNAYRGQVSAFVTATTTTGFTIRYYNASAAAVSVGITYAAIGT